MVGLRTGARDIVMATAMMGGQESHWHRTLLIAMGCIWCDVRECQFENTCHRRRR